METKRNTQELLHDIRSSLSVIQSNAELACMIEGVPADARKSMEEVITEVGQIATIVSTLSERNAKHD